MSLPDAPCMAYLPTFTIQIHHMPYIEHLGPVTGSRKSLKNVSFASGKYALLLAPLIPLNFRHRNLVFAQCFLCQFPIPEILFLLISKTFSQETRNQWTQWDPNFKKNQEMEILES